MRKRESSYSVSRIRLINFHNFVNETIEVKGGGHLFMLGDNGSGKTTVLDAIHYVLTAGDLMEFNSAARVAGSKEGGRRPQGIITRYNVDTGHMNPEGGVSYAALEVRGGRGKVWTLAIGMSVSSPTDALKRWGLIREGELEEIPFLVKGRNGMRPRSGAEMRKALGGAGYYGQINAYKSQVAERFMGGAEMFRDCCHFLSMGKAYREIVAHSSDYHALFKKLLPRPGAGVFERIIESLKSLDSSKADMEGLRGRHAYTAELRRGVEEVGSLRCRALEYEALALALEKRLNAEEHESLSRRLGELTLLVKEKDEALELLRGREQELGAKLDDLKGRDSGGVLRQEQELLGRIKLLKRRLSESERGNGEGRGAIEEMKSRHEERLGYLKGQAREALGVLTESSAKVDFSSPELLAVLETIAHEGLPAGDGLEAALDAMYDRLRTEHMALTQRRHSTEATLERLLETEEELNMEIMELERSPEAEPDVRYFGDAVKELRSADIDFMVLHQGLEWSRKADEGLRGAVEEFIGPRILGTLLVSGDDFERASEIIYNEFPGVRIACAGEKDKPSKDFMSWAGGVFDARKSNAFCLAALERELKADDFPKFTELNGFVCAAFRGHSYSLVGYEPQLVGAETRRRAQAAKLKERQDEIAGVGSDIKSLQAESKEADRKLKALKKLHDFVDKRVRPLREVMREITTLRQELAHKEELCGGELKRSRELGRELKDCEERLAAARKLIAKDELQDLDAKIAELSTELGHCRASQEEEFGEKIRAEGRLENARAAMERIVRRLTELDGALTTAGGKLALPEDTELTAYLERLCAERRIRCQEDARAAAEVSRAAALRLQGHLRARLEDHAYAGVWAFQYDEERNAIFDRSGADVSEIEELQRHKLEEQQELINERTSELFRKIVVTELATYLKEMRGRLKEMVKSINGLLEGRTFGNNSYRFQLSPVERHMELERLIGGHAAYDSGSEKALEAFFQEHREEIVLTEPGEVPECLDYRNWYHYDMKILASGGEGKVMDRHVKSVGSGGEQAVPNYLLILTIAHFLYRGSGVGLRVLLFDEAFYGIDAQRRDQLMGFAGDLGLQLFVASPDQDGVRREIFCSTSILVVKDKHYDVHLFPFHWRNPEVARVDDMFTGEEVSREIAFSEELSS